MKVSIILPIYNVDKYLERALDSIVNQTYENWECFLINDGSTDNSEKICKLYVEKDKRFKLYSQKNSGSGIARNNGLKRANGDYICFIDPDDYISHYALKENIDIALEFKPDVIANGYLEINEQSSKKMEPKITGYLNQNEFRNNFLIYSEIGSNSLWNKLYKNDFLNENRITFNSQRTGQDAIFNHKVYKQLNCIFINDECYYKYDRSREGSAVNTYNAKRIEHEKNILNSYIDMIDYWGLEEQFYNEILKKKWTVLYHQIRNINLANNPFSWDEKKNILINMRNNNDFIKIKNNLSPNLIGSRISKLIFILFSLKLYSFILIIINIYIRI